MKTLLALDLGTTTGWALYGTDGTFRSGAEAFKPQRFEGGGMRYLRFSRWLDEVGRDVVLIAYEEVRRHEGVDAAHVYGGLQGHLTAWCEAHAVPYQAVPVGTIKKHATGKGNASKDAVLTAMIHKGHPALHPTAFDEADALALLHWMLDDETSRLAIQRHAPHGEPGRRVPVGAVPLAHRAGGPTRGQDAVVPRGPDGRQGLSPGSPDEPVGARRRRSVIVGR